MKKFLTFALIIAGLFVAGVVYQDFGIELLYAKINSNRGGERALEKVPQAALDHASSNASFKRMAQLVGFAEGNPDAAILIAGSTDQLVSKYHFRATGEAFVINKLTLVNDESGELGDDVVSTSAVTTVKVRYRDSSDVTQTVASSLSSGGKATFSGLDIFVPADGDAFVEVLVNVTSMAAIGESLSGKTFRIGIQNEGNSITTFEAVGQSSATVDYFTDGDEIANQLTVNGFVVRKTKPTFAKVAGLSTTLVNGPNRLYGLTVAADSAGAVSFGRLSFTVSENTSGTLSDFRFFRGSNLLNSQVEIFDGLAGNDVSDGSGNSLTNGGADVIVSFNIEESVAAGASQTYILDATLSSVTINETVNTKLAVDDEVASVAGKTTDTNPNTARVYSTTAASGLFNASTTDFSDTSIAGRAHVWSDVSADTHTYPTVSSGAVTSDSGSFDWTNGYLLEMDEVASHTLMK